MSPSTRPRPMRERAAGTTTPRRPSTHRRRRQDHEGRHRRVCGGGRQEQPAAPEQEGKKSAWARSSSSASLMVLVGLAVDGLPKGFRSTQGRRNKLLRNFAGDADRCCDQAFATTMSEDAIQFLVAFVPGLGLVLRSLPRSGSCCGDAVGVCVARARPEPTSNKSSRALRYGRDQGRGGRRGAR